MHTRWVHSIFYHRNRAIKKGVSKERWGYLERLNDFLMLVGGKTLIEELYCLLETKDYMDA